jgi:hypothetical protein
MKVDGACHSGYVTFEAEADPETTSICKLHRLPNDSVHPPERNPQHRHLTLS